MDNQFDFFCYKCDIQNFLFYCENCYIYFCVVCSEKYCMQEYKEYIIVLFVLWGLIIRCKIYFIVICEFSCD